MKTYTICGSMRYEKEMMKIAYYLETEKGYNIYNYWIKEYLLWQKKIKKKPVLL